MKSLYSRLARQWDVLFPADDDRIAFVSDLSGVEVSDHRIIEVGCGTGKTAISLASTGYSVAASDLDPEMVEIAKQSVQMGSVLVKDGYYGEPGFVRFSIDDMIGALEAAPPGSANIILCLGNTLPHLTETDEMARFFRAAGTALAPGGKLVVQILNYRRIIGLGTMKLSDLHGDGIVFRRSQIYLPEKGSVTFQTEVESEGIIERRTHNLYPLTLEELVSYSAEAGLRETGIYCDWKKTAFTEDSPWLAGVFMGPGASG